MRCSFCAPKQLQQMLGVYKASWMLTQVLVTENDSLGSMTVYLDLLGNLGIFIRASHNAELIGGFLCCLCSLLCMP